MQNKSLLETIEEISGLGKKTTAEILAQVKENHHKLESCKSHSFSEDVTPNKKFNKRWQCINCQGEVDSIAKSWYEKGREHEQNEK